MPRLPLESWIVTRNCFKDHQLAPQTTTSLSGVLCPRSHVSWKASLEVTHHKISSQQARLIVEFLRVDLPKRKVLLWWYK